LSADVTRIPLLSRYFGDSAADHVSERIEACDQGTARVHRNRKAPIKGGMTPWAGIAESTQARDHHDVVVVD
jgi:hypothetical protein